MSGQSPHASPVGLGQSREMCLRKGRQHSVKGKNEVHEPFRTTSVASALLGLGAVPADMTLDRESSIAVERSESEVRTNPEQL